MQVRGSTDRSLGSGGMGTAAHGFVDDLRRGDFVVIGRGRGNGPFIGPDREEAARPRRRRVEHGLLRDAVLPEDSLRAFLRLAAEIGVRTAQHPVSLGVDVHRLLRHRFETDADRLVLRGADFERDVGRSEVYFEKERRHGESRRRQVAQFRHGGAVGQHIGRIDRDVGDQIRPFDQFAADLASGNGFVSGIFGIVVAAAEREARQHEKPGKKQFDITVVFHGSVILGFNSRDWVPAADSAAVPCRGWATATGISEFRDARRPCPYAPYRDR